MRCSNCSGYGIISCAPILLISGVASTKTGGGAKCLILGEQQYFCLGRRFSKHKMTRYAKNFGGEWPPGYDYILNLQTYFKSRLLPTLHTKQWFMLARITMFVWQLRHCNIICACKYLLSKTP